MLGIAPCHRVYAPFLIRDDGIQIYSPAAAADAVRFYFTVCDHVADFGSVAIKQRGYCPHPGASAGLCIY